MDPRHATAARADRRPRFRLEGPPAAWRAVGTFAVAVLLLAGCSDIEYYWQGVAGQTDLLARAKPIIEVIATTPDTALKGRLQRAQEIRAFASRELGLPDNRSYTSYADLGRPYAVWMSYVLGSWRNPRTSSGVKWRPRGSKPWDSTSRLPSAPS